MKKITFFLLAIICLLSKPNHLFSQTNLVRCNTTEHTKMLQQQHPEMFKNQERIESHTQRVLKKTNNLQKTNDIITIPVVVHVLYRTLAQNISDAQILSQIDVLNEDFRRLNPDASDTPADFLPVAADTEIEFCLASYDPDGNPTSGITRKSSTVASWSNNNLKFSDQGGIDAWPTGDYLNIWVVNTPYLGFAQFPGGPADTDGIVCLYYAFGRVGVLHPDFNLGRTATHEVGHWLNLKHIWGDGGFGEDGCAVDDFVSDTPNAAFENYTGSPCTHGGINSCDEGEGDLPDMFQNYMDYSKDACFNLFTIGQKNRMRALFEPGGARESLLNSTACNPLPDYCSNDLQDNDETGVDCGGSCMPCVSCTDGIQNGEEVGVDCGGAACIPCSGCTDSDAHNYDLFSGLDDGSCETCSDGILNGDETHIDCGGNNCSPCNNFCTEASEILCGETKFGSSSTATFTDLPDLPDLCGDVVYPIAGVWFTFEGTGENMILSTDHAGTGYDTNLQVYSGDCDDLTCIAGNEDGGGDYLFGSTSELSFPTVIGTDYYVYLSGFFGSGGNYELTKECYAPLDITVASVLGIPHIGTGSIGITVTGGYLNCGLLTYAWTGPNGYSATTENATGLTVAGMYTLTVTDCLGNVETISVNVPVRTRGRGRGRKTAFTDIPQLTAAPNPFRNETQIHFEVETGGEAFLEVFDIRGAKVATLFEGQTEVGQEYQVSFGTAMPAGTYIAKLTTANGEVQHIKLLLTQ